MVHVSNSFLDSVSIICRVKRKKLVVKEFFFFFFVSFLILTLKRCVLMGIPRGCGPLFRQLDQIPNKVGPLAPSYERG